MMKLEAYPQDGKPFRVILEEKREGTYVFVFSTAENKFPDRDMLQDDIAMAKIACEEDFGIGQDDWKAVDD